MIPFLALHCHTILKIICVLAALLALTGIAISIFRSTPAQDDPNEHPTTD